jgi:chromosome segregation ATPase
MSKWDELKKWAQDYQDWNDAPELREVLSKMTELEEQDDGSEDLESRMTFLEGALQHLEKRLENYGENMDVLLNRFEEHVQRSESVENSLTEARSTFEDEYVCFVPWNTTTSKPGDGGDE